MEPCRRGWGAFWLKVLARAGGPLSPGAQQGNLLTTTEAIRSSLVRNLPGFLSSRKRYAANSPVFSVRLESATAPVLHPTFIGSFSKRTNRECYLSARPTRAGPAKVHTRRPTS